jgi:hypothetical protein
MPYNSKWKCRLTSKRRSSGRLLREWVGRFYFSNSIKSISIAECLRENQLRTNLVRKFNIKYSLLSFVHFGTNLVPNLFATTYLPCTILVDISRTYFMFEGHLTDISFIYRTHHAIISISDKKKLGNTQVTYHRHLSDIYRTFDEFIGHTDTLTDICGYSEIFEHPQITIKKGISELISQCRLSCISNCSQLFRCAESKWYRIFSTSFSRGTQNFQSMHRIDIHLMLTKWMSAEKPYLILSSRMVLLNIYFQ